MQGRLVSKLVKPHYSALQDIGQNSILYKGFHGSKHVNNIGSLDQNVCSIGRILLQAVRYCAVSLYYY